jgi:hypothetical protein
MPSDHNDEGRPLGKGGLRQNIATNGDNVIVLSRTAAVAPPVPGPGASDADWSAFWLELSAWASTYRSSWGRSA